MGALRARCSPMLRHVALAPVNASWYRHSPAGGFWRASRCSPSRETHDADREIAGIEKGAQVARHPLQLPTHSATRKGGPIPSTGTARSMPGRLVLRGSQAVDRRADCATRQPNRLNTTPDWGALSGTVGNAVSPLFSSPDSAKPTRSLSDTSSSTWIAAHIEWHIRTLIPYMPLDPCA